MPRRHPLAQKARRPADPEDVFIEKTLAFSGWARHNRQALIGSGIVVVAIVLASTYYVNYRRSHLESAVLELERVQQVAAFGDTVTAKVDLAQYIESFGNTHSAREARLLLGQLYMETGQPEEAVAALEDAADLSDPLGLQAAVLLAKAREQRGELQEAEALFLRIADRAQLDLQAHEALAHVARFRERRDDPSGAADLYRRILDDLDENDPSRPLYEMRLQEMLTRANAEV